MGSNEKRPELPTADASLEMYSSERNTSQDSITSPKRLLDDFLRDSNQPSVLLDEPIPQLRPAGTFASAITLLDEAPRENVLSITQHRLTRLIDMNPGLSRAEIIGLQLCSEKGDASNRYYVMLQLRRKGENVIMWLRLEQTWKRQRLSLLKKSSESVKRTARLSPLKDELTVEEELIQEHLWQSASPPTLHALQHTLCVISDSLQSDRYLLADGSLFCSLLLKHWGIEWPVKNMTAISQHEAKVSKISNRVMENLQQLASISLPSSVASSIEQFNQGATVGEFIEKQHYDTCVVHDLTRYRAKGQFYHEFVVIHAVNQENHDQWFRFDRAAYLTSSIQLSAASSSSDVAAKDAILISVEKQTLFKTPREDDVRQVAFVAFSDDSGQPTIRDLRELLRNIYKIAPKYNLLKENCRFVASVIQEGLTRKFPAQLVGEKPTWTENHAHRVAEEILGQVW